MFSGEDVIRKHIPDFDLFELDEVRWLLLEFYRPDQDPNTMITDMILNIGYCSNSDTYYLKLRLSDVRQLRLPELGGAWFQIGELEIASIADHGLEGINYHVISQLDGFSCYCRDVHFTALSKGLIDGSEQILWISEAGIGSRYLGPQ
jgi:hypothetical protein